MTIKINASAIAQARDYAANYDQDDFQQEKARLRRDLLAHFSPSELEQVPYNTLVSHIFNADWLTTDPNNWFEAPPFKRRIGLVDISIAKKDAINDYDEAKKRHAKFLRQLRFQSLFS